MLLRTIGKDSLLPRLQEANEKGDAVNVYSMTREYSMDLVTGYIFGMGNGTNWVKSPNEAAHYLSAFQHAVEPFPFFASTEIQRLVSVLDWFGLKLIPPSVNTAFDTIHSFVMELTTSAVSIMKTEEFGKKDAAGIFNQVWHRLGNLSEAQRIRLIASDMVDQIHAGHEATGIVLTYFMWELSSNVDIQDRLRSELRTSSDPQNSELLDAALLETIRLYPAGFGPFPRVAPANAVVAGFAIPEGTTTSASPFTLGRNSNVFPQPDMWLPDRWLKATPDQKRKMKKWVWMFMSGPRVCIGEHLAVAGESNQAWSIIKAKG